MKTDEKLALTHRRGWAPLTRNRSGAWRDGNHLGNGQEAVSPRRSSGVKPTNRTSDGVRTQMDCLRQGPAGVFQRTPIAVGMETRHADSFSPSH